MSSIWDEFKDLFKTKTQREDDRQKQIEDALVADDELSAKLDALDKAYAEYQKNSAEKEENLEKLFPPSLDLDEIEYTPKSDEELAKNAADSLEYDKTADLNDVNNKYSSSESKIKNSIQDEKTSFEQQYKNLESLYKELAEKSKNNAIKNGIARGSILTSELEALENDKTASVQDVKSAYENAIDSYSEQLDGLKASKEQALEELDLKYAAELQEKIDKLKKEQDATVLKYEKYNNSVKEKQADYSAQRAKDVQNYLQKQAQNAAKNAETQAAYEAQYGYSGEKQKNYAARYELALDFYTSLSPEIAADALEASPSMKYYLGNYYEKLMAALDQSKTNTNKYY